MGKITDDVAYPTVDAAAETDTYLTIRAGALVKTALAKILAYLGITRAVDSLTIDRPVVMGSTAQVAGVTDTTLTASLPMFSDANKKHVTKSAADARSALGITDLGTSVRRSGASTFNGTTGRTVAIADVGTTNYRVSIIPTAVGAYIGNITVGNKAANSFVVYNSGSDVATAFDYILIVD